MTKKDHKIIQLDWIDSCGAGNGWSEKERASPATMLVKSVGYIVHEDETTITLSTGYNPNSCHAPITIPKFAIQKKKFIK